MWEAFEIAHELDIRYTPKQGSWLDRAEIALSAMSSHCLDGRIETQEDLSRELEAWQFDRDTNGKTVTWRFTTEYAWIKLRRLYPPF